MTVTILPGAIDALLAGDHGSPFDVLGPHPVAGGISIRAFQPMAQALTVIFTDTGTRYAMNRVRGEGFFEVVVPQPVPRYHYEAVLGSGETTTFADPYAFGPQITDYDLHLLSEGRDLHSYEKLGAHIRQIDGVQGVHFAVWAPNARRVSVIGDFNGWNPFVNPMRRHDSAGIWELFIPGVTEGQIYRYDIISRFNNYYAQKSDPYAFYSELRPKNASVVADLDGYAWGDQAWMEARRTRDLLREPMSIYEVHLGSWRHDAEGNWLNYRELADALVDYAKEMGFTHLELMPISEHPFDGSWGYQTTGYFAVTSRYGSPKDFMYFVDQCHQNGIGVILDWVPAHFPKDGHALSYFDGTHLYEHADPRQAEHPDWGTYIFNYGRNEVRNFLISNALFWLQVYHFDGLRVDAVSSMLYLNFSREDGQWIPNAYGGSENLEAIAFLTEFNAIVHREFPGTMTIAEESTSWPMVSRPTYLGGLGFTFKWNMGWMHDTLDYIAVDHIYRRWSHSKITFAMWYAHTENFVLSLSHDEVVHLKGSLISKAFGDWWQQFATLRLLYGYQMTFPGKKLNFMGQEFGQWREWSETRALDWDLLHFPTHAGAQRWLRDLNRLYQTEPALTEEDLAPQGFQWIEPNDVEQSVYTYIRFATDRSDFVIVALNFTPVPRYNYRIGVPEPGYYREIINSDSAHYGGSNVGSGGGVHTEFLAWHTWDQSLSLTVPPLGMVVLKRVRPSEAADEPPGNNASGGSTSLF
ncbi:MAG: 1,4-alpha-glucan branching protein GlgB [Chloroflexi bacterium]|nr:1,4-alpha-glucan branching protein GlgB [Chloroflexota bacterium]